MRVGITGSTGFVGTALCRAIVEAGWEAVPISRPIEDARTGALDAIVHLAGKAHAHGADRSEYENANVETSRAAAELARSSGATRFIFLSTSKVFGERSAVDEPLTGSSDISPVGPYAETKREAEMLLVEEVGADLDLIILRPPVIYGPDVKGNLRLISSLVEKGMPLPDFGSVRSYLSLTVLCDAIVSLLGRGSERGVAIRTIADGPPVSTGQLMHAFGARLDRSPRVIPMPNVASSLFASLDRRVFRRRFGALINHFVLDHTDLRDLIPTMVDQDTIALLSMREP